MSGFRLYHPHQCGWLRRPECDYPRLETWEKPDGSLHVHDPKSGKLLLTFFDVTEGEKPNDPDDWVRSLR